jgi:hypothetical protein
MIAEVAGGVGEQLGAHGAAVAAAPCPLPRGSVAGTAVEVSARAPGTTDAGSSCVDPAGDWIGSIATAASPSSPRELRR